MGKYAKQILELSWPVMVGMILQSLMVTFDLFFISKLGTAYTSAASMATSMLHVTFATAALTAAGAIAIAARGVGEGDWQKVQSATGSGAVLSVGIGLLLAVVCVTWTTPLLKGIYRTEDVELLRLSSQYLKVGFWSIPFLYVSGCLRNIIQGTGDTLRPVVIFGIANIMNIILDPIFIFALDMELAGAALATLLSLVVAALLTVGLVVWKLYDRSFIGFVRSMKPDFSRSLQILKIGSWASFQQIARPITGLIMMAIVLQAGGKTASAAFGIGMQLFGYTFIFFAGLATAVAILTGQSLGRGEPEKVDELVRSGLKLAFFNIVLFALPYVFFPEQFFRIFLDDPMVLEVGRNYLRIIYVCMPFTTLNIVFAGVFNGSGMTRPPMMASLGANVFFKLPLAYILAIPMQVGTNGVWIAISASIFVEAAVITWHYRAGLWREYQIE